MKTRAAARSRNVRGGVRAASVGLAALAAALALGFAGWTRLARYEAFPQAAAVMAAGEKAPRGWRVFRPASPGNAGLIFYPGALVDPAAYAPLLRAVADRGFTAVIVPMPLDLAVFGMEAAQYVSMYPDSVRGIVFMASYPGGGIDLSGLSLAAASIYGTRDDVAGDAPGAAASRLPRGTAIVVLEGGNHAQFGDYGPQAGDGTASISRAEQQRLAVDAISEILFSIARR